jgi:hypothetical protein
VAKPAALSIQVPEETVEAIAQRVAEILSAQPEARWLYGDKAAADYLGWPLWRSARTNWPATSVRKP